MIMMQNNNVCIIADDSDVFVSLLLKLSNSTQWYVSETAESSEIIKHNLYMV